ncbi:MAG TPA: YidC/Oxa1 family membrane protein insertase [Anaerovoracaceae bacterium]|nr:YidC/Oxa1 family membrane protein insertase [Anaerovoracaceae bacterium]
MSIFGIIAKPMGWLLTLIYGFVGSYGVALLILTFLVKGLLYPLYARQIKSTAAMSSIQPKMKEIQKKYADDKKTMNEKMSELYKEEGFNPAGGCLPMVIQMPIIISLFTLLRNPMNYIEDENMLFAIHESFLWIRDLSQPDLWILPILAGIATFVSFSMMQTLNTGGGANQGQMMQAVMKYFFPLSILWLARSYPAGLAIYWFGSQFAQIFINIRMNKLRARAKEEQDNAIKKKSKR